MTSVLPCERKQRTDESTVPPTDTDRELFHAGQHWARICGCRSSQNMMDWDSGRDATVVGHQPSQSLSKSKLTNTHPPVQSTHSSQTHTHTHIIIISPSCVENFNSHHRCHSQHCVPLSLESPRYSQSNPGPSPFLVDIQVSSTGKGA